MLEGEADRLREEIAYMKLLALEEALEYIAMKTKIAYQEWIDAAF